jgi:hypothetical protein
MQKIILTYSLIHYDLDVDELRVTISSTVRDNFENMENTYANAPVPVLLEKASIGSGAFDSLIFEKIQGSKSII